MDADTTGLKSRRAVRSAVEQTRCRPNDRTVVVVAFDSDGELEITSSTGPLELIVEATGPDGELADWLVDAWWTAAVQTWSCRTVTLHISPTPGGLLHPVVLSHLEMVRRVSPGWRIVGHANTEEITAGDVSGQLATSPYHEIRFVDRSRPSASTSEDGTRPTPLEELFARVRREQERHGAAGPILTRLPCDADIPQP